MTLSKIPKFRRFVLQNFPFIEQDFDALTDYELLCKVVEYLNNVIDSQNEVTAEFEALSEAFTELNNYVTNYFDNLDVQEEINNKLEDMVEDGTLQAIITEYIQANVAFVFDTVADMKLATNLINGSYARTLGFHSKNDGGAALYTISDSGTANEKDVIAVANDLLATLVVDSSNVYPEQFGAYGDGTHDDSAVIQYVVDNYTVIKFKSKEYKVSSGILIQGNHTLIGDNENYMNAYVGALGTVFTGNNKTSVGMRIYNDDNSSISVHIENITLQDYTNGIYAISCVCSTFKNVICRKNNTGLKITGTCYENKWDHCQFFRNTEDGFLCGITDTHPVLGTTLTPSMSTEDFYSCAFAKNGRHGIHGFLTTTNFFGGFCEENGEAGVYLLSTTGKSIVKDTFIGFDIENERVGYFFDSTDPTRLEVSDINIIGGQVTLLNENDHTNAIMYFKGVSIFFEYVYNIFFRTRKAVPATAYDVYVEATGGGTTSMCGDINNGNRNNKLKTNIDVIYPDCLNSFNGVLPLRAFGGNYYDNSTDTVFLTAVKSLSFSLNKLVLLSTLKLTLSANSTFRVSVYGRKVIDLLQIYNNNNVTGTLTDGKYVMTLNPGAKADVITITNTTASDATIESANIVGYFYQY